MVTSAPDFWNSSTPFCTFSIAGFGFIMHVSMIQYVMKVLLYNGISIDDEF